MKKSIFFDVLIIAIALVLLYTINIPYLNVLLAFLLIFIYSSLNGNLKKDLGFKKQNNILKLFGIAISLAVCIVFLSYYVFLNPIEKLTESTLQLGGFNQIKGNFNIYIISILIGWVVGGLFEEVIFRGFFISKFIDIIGNKFGAILGVILSSIIFGSLHSYQGISGQILTGLFGLIIATIYLLSKRNLWLIILIHGFVNTISMTLLYFDLLPI